MPPGLKPVVKYLPLNHVLPEPVPLFLREVLTFGYLQRALAYKSHTFKSVNRKSVIL